MYIKKKKKKKTMNAGMSSKSLGNTVQLLQLVRQLVLTIRTALLYLVTYLSMIVATDIAIAKDM